MVVAASNSRKPVSKIELLLVDKAMRLIVGNSQLTTGASRLAILKAIEE